MKAEWLCILAGLALGDLIPVCGPLTKWTPATILPSMCDIEDSIGHDDGVPVRITQLSMSTTDPEVMGFLCTKLILTTRCTYYWYFHSTVERLIIKEPVSTQECLDQLTKINQADGDEPIPYFPSEECVWQLGVSVIDKKHPIILIKSHSVMLDLRENKLVDNVFLNNRCKEAICDTIHENVKWIRKGTTDPCTQSQVTEGTIYTTKQNTKYLQGTLLPPMPMSQMCWETICGRPTLRTPQGIPIWINVNELITGVARCSEGINSVTFLKPQAAEIEELALLQNTMDWIICQMAVRNFNSNQSAIDLPRVLNLLQPHRPGVHPVYQMFNQTLKTASCPYVNGTYQTSRRGNQLGIGSHGNPIPWYFWNSISSGPNEFCKASGPNGISRDIDCRVIKPYKRASALQHYLSNKESLTMMFPEVGLTHDLPQETLVKLLNPKKTVISFTSMLESLDHAWVYFKLSILYWIVSVLLVIGIVWILPWTKVGIVRCCCQLRSSQLVNDSDRRELELMPI